MTATDDLAALLARRAELQATVDDLHGRLVFASDDVQRASSALAQAERERLRGDGSAAAVSAAEKALAKARQMSVRAAAAVAGVPRSTLHDHTRR